MRSQTRLDLRGKDATSLEVLVPDALSITLGQLAPSSLADMMALAECPSLPKSLAGGLEKFCKRMEGEIADLPSEAVCELTDALDAHGHDQIPARLRAVVETEAARAQRSSADRARLQALVESWQQTEAAPFEIAQGAGPKVTKTAEVKAEAAPAKRTRAKAAPKKRTVVVADPVQTRWIEQNILERLAGYSENGLAEMVLVAGVRHAARAQWPHMGQAEVNVVLKALKASGRARYSAGRWSIPGRW